MAEKENKETLPATVKLSTTPKEATQEARNTAVFLKKLLDQKPNPVMIHGNRHMEFEDWITLGNYYGLSIATRDAEPVEVFGVKGFKAQADVIRIEDGVRVGGSEAYCFSDEKNWRGKPLFQLASMAQTRAGSKALANVLRWVVALEGISGTPAEEMTNTSKRVKPSQVVNTPEPPAPPKKAAAKKTKKATSKNPKIELLPNYDELRKTCKPLDMILEEMDLTDEKLTDTSIIEAGSMMVGRQDLTPGDLKAVRKALQGA